MMLAATLERDLSPLVRAAASGDASAFAFLVDASRNAVASIALAICRDVATSEDVAQEVYLVVWRRLSELRNPASFLPWVRQITRYTARTWMRGCCTAERRLQVGRGTDDDRESDDLLARAVDPGQGPETSVLNRERDRIVSETLNDLPDEPREVVILYYREGRSSQQVAQLLGLSDSAVRKRLQRARHELRREVLDRFAAAARQTAPGVTFTAAVMTATTSAPIASAAGLAGVATAPHTGAKIASLFGGAGLGFLGGAAGVVFGLRKDFRDALDAWERSQLRAIRNRAVLAVLVTSIGFALPALHTHWFGPTALCVTLLATLGCLYFGWLPKLRCRRFMAEEDGDLEAVRRRLNASRRQTLFGWSLGALCGGGGLIAGLIASGLL